MPAAEPRWQAGDVVVLRYLRRTTGLPGAAWPLSVVEDTDELVALYLPKGTRFTQMRGAEPKVRVWGAWHLDTLRLMFPGRSYSVWLSWAGEGAARSFSYYYVNMEEPFRRTPIGFDTNDHQLDIVVQPNMSWSLKDEELFEEFVQAGHYSGDFAEHVRSEAQAVIGLVESRASP
ncbi:MAG: DUF402 domain-containing protein, partial [Dehalococcoidia bacterium]